MTSWYTQYYVVRSVRAGQAGNTSNLTSCGAVVQCVEVEIEFKSTADEFVRQQSDLTEPMMCQRKWINVKL